MLNVVAFGKKPDDSKVKMIGKGAWKISVISVKNKKYILKKMMVF